MYLKKSSSDKSKLAIDNIITLNAYTDKKCILLKDKSFQYINKLTHNTSNLVTSYISNKDIISTTIYISRSIPQEDIDDILNIKAYEELGLDQASNYIISSTEIKSISEEREFHVFVAQSELLDKLYLSAEQQTKYIDLIIPAPLLYKALYEKGILPDEGVDCFIYFTKHDAFVTFYKNGEYLYAKSIEYSLDQIYDKFCEIAGDTIDKDEFFSILESEGLKTIKGDYQQNFMKVFSEIFITINDIIIYAKRTLQLETINHVFIGSVNGPIIGLDEYSQNYLGLPSSDLNFNYDMNNDEWYIDQLQYLMLLNSFDYMEDESSVVNLTMYPRPPSFLNRASGQFIIAIFTAISLGMIYPLTYLVGSYLNDAQIYALTIENNELTVEANKYKQILAEKKQKISALDKEIELLLSRYHEKTKTLTSIYDKKVNYRLKSDMFYTIAEELNKFDVNVDTLYSQEDILWISLVSSDDRKLTELIRYISDNHFNDIKLIDIERIHKDSENNHYKGLLKVDLK